jgi:hypothetical protein
MSPEVADLLVAAREEAEKHGRRVHLLRKDGQDVDRALLAAEARRPADDG